MGKSRWEWVHGKRIKVQTLESAAKPNKKRPAFKAQFVQVPAHWKAQLAACKSWAVYQLALHILEDSHRQEHDHTACGEIILSASTTGLPHTTRARAIAKLVRLELIQVERNGRCAVRVITLAGLKWRPHTRS